MLIESFTYDDHSDCRDSLVISIYYLSFRLYHIILVLRLVLHVANKGKTQIKGYEFLMSVFLPSASTSLTMSVSSFTVGLYPILRITSPISRVLIVPSASLSYRANAFLHSAIENVNCVLHNQNHHQNHYM